MVEGREKGVKSILFLYLKAFDSTGGIEKVNRTLMKALNDIHEEHQTRVRVVSPYETSVDERYFRNQYFSGYGGKRWRFMAGMLWKNLRSDTLIIGHINLAPAAFILKKRYPDLKTVVISHGIEVWKPLHGVKRHLLQRADRIIAVSRFTAEKLVSVQGIHPGKITVLPNCLDPFFTFQDTFSKPDYLLRRYGLVSGQPVLLTLTRLNANEIFKGYDHVLTALPGLTQQFPGLCYILAGKCDDTERPRLENRIRELGIESQVRLPGYIPGAELNDHYRLADVFVMPSKKEGFGLVFIEALACGAPVVAGNADGSAEALLDGRLGRLVDPDDPEAIAEAIRQSLLQPGDPAERQQAVKAAFNYSEYKARLENILFSPA